MKANLQAVLDSFSASDELNRLPDEFGREPFFAQPLIGVARGDDPIFREFKKVVAPEHLTPAEMWLKNGLPAGEGMPARLRVVSIVFPYTSTIREAGKTNRGAMPPEVYCVARNYADSFIDAALERTVRFFEEHACRAMSGIGSCAFQLLSDSESDRIYANWSERHVAFAAGLGTFSLHEALITEVGCNVRIGSVITDAPIAVTPRPSDEPYANCLHFAKGTCTACIAKCPAGAITKEGHDKSKCRLYGREVRDDVCARPLRTVLKAKHLKVGGDTTTTFSVGCALCQFGVPCMDRNPMASS